MADATGISEAKDRALFTPGPLTTSRTVKAAMMRDLGSRDDAFVATIARIRTALLDLAGVDASTHAAIPMQGSGTFGLEATVGSVIPPDGKLLVAVNGAYGRRLVQIARVLKIAVDTVEFPEDRPVDPAAVADALAADAAVTHVSACQCETTSGIVNPVEAIGRVARDAGRSLILDAMSGFGAIPIHVERAGVDYLVSSANKCIEGVPGFSFVIARLAPLLASKGFARSLSLDLVAQHEGLERDGQFRFTPPTHALLAFEQALRELTAEGGPEGRGRRYAENHRVLVEGMRVLGFREYLAADLQGPIITSFRYPAHPAFRFEEFYARLNRDGFVIYPGKVGSADCFRIGTIGRVFPADVRGLLAAIRRALIEMGACGAEGTR